MDLHKKNASLFDVAFIDVTQCDKEDCEKMSKEYPFAASRSPFEENFKHKYLIDIVSSFASCSVDTGRKG